MNPKAPDVNPSAEIVEIPSELHRRLRHLVVDRRLQRDGQGDCR